MFPFVPRERQLGNKYHQPVIVRQEHGITYAAPESGAFALNSAVSMQTQDAVVPGYQIVLRATLDYEAAAKATSSGPRAFRDATELQVENMLESHSKRLELAILHGQAGVGVGDTSSNVDATTTDVTLTTASWSSGIWSGMEGAVIQFWTAANALVGTSSPDADFSISTVDIDTKTLTVTGTATGIAALDVALGAGDCDIYFKGARTGAAAFGEMAGLSKIITNTGSLFGIDASVYNLWRGNTYGAAGALTFAKLQSAVARAVGRGLSEDVDVLVNPVTWGNLLTDQAALRMYDSSYSAATVENGAKTIKFHGQNGVMNIHSHIYVKEGEAFVVPSKRVKRIGATDISFNVPGSTEGEIFRQLENNAGFEYRNYSNQAIILETPARAVKVTGIVNT